MYLPRKVILPVRTPKTTPDKGSEVSHVHTQSRKRDCITMSYYKLRVKSWGRARRSLKNSFCVCVCVAASNTVFRLVSEFWFCLDPDKRLLFEIPFTYIQQEAAAKGTRSRDCPAKVKILLHIKNTRRR